MAPIWIYLGIKVDKNCLDSLWLGLYVLWFDLLPLGHFTIFYTFYNIRSEFKIQFKKYINQTNLINKNFTYQLQNPPLFLPLSFPLPVIPTPHNPPSPFSSWHLWPPPSLPSSPTPNLPYSNPSSTDLIYHKKILSIDYDSENSAWNSLKGRE